MKDILDHGFGIVGGIMVGTLIYGVILSMGLEASSPVFIVLAIIYVFILYGVIRTSLRPLERFIVGSLLYTCICLISSILGFTTNAAAQLNMTFDLLIILLGIYLARKYVFPD